MCALAEAHALFPAEDDFVLISLGCGEVPRGSASAKSEKKRRRILDFSLTAQSDCVDYQMRTFLSHERYIRIQTDLVPDLDRIDDPSNLLAMEEITRQTIRRYTDVLDRVVDLLAASPRTRFELAVA
jgi:hypothetical protein